MAGPSSSSAALDPESSSLSPKVTSALLVPGDSVEDGFEAPLPSSIDLSVELSLSHEVFRDQEFDPDEFLYSRRHTSLDDLRTELRAYLSGLRSELVGVINEDYEDFIGLGMGLRGTVERTMGKMKAPVENSRREVQTIRENLDQQREEVESLLSERRKVMDGKKLVRLMLDCGDAVSKVEEMLTVQQPSTKDISASFTKKSDKASSRLRSGSSKHIIHPELVLEGVEDQAGIEGRTKRIERITKEYNQMLYLVSKGSDLAYVNQLRPRINSITETLHRELGSLFKSTLHTPRSDHRKRHCLLECLRAYEALEAVREAENIIKDEVVVPGMSQLIHRNSLNPGSMSPVLPASPEVSRFKIDSHPSSDRYAPPTTGNTQFLSLPLPDDPELVPLPLLYNKILAFIAREMVLILDVADLQSKHSNQLSSDPTTANNRSNSKPTFNVLINSIISPTLQLISNNVGPSLFASGNPSTFHRNYSCTVSFLDRLESFCSSPRQVLGLRAHPDWQNFKNKWQLQVYAQIRTKEMIFRIEEGLRDGLRQSESPSSSNPNRSISKGTNYLLKSTETIDRVILSMWNEEIFLTDLTHRFWRLTLMALSRYKTWLDQITIGFDLNPASSQINSSVSPVRSGTPIESNRSAVQPNQANRNERMSSNSNGGRSNELNEDEKLRDMTIILVDILLLKDRILELFEVVIGPRIPKVNVGTDSLKPEDILKISLGKFLTLVPLLSEQITKILVKRCSEKLRFIRTVGSSARASKSVPKEPSYFISDILTDLRNYLNRFGDHLSLSLSSTKTATTAITTSTNNTENRTMTSSKLTESISNDEVQEVEEEDIKSILINSIIEEIFNRYLSILINVQRSEDSLKKLKRGRKKQGFSIFNSSSNSKAIEDKQRREDGGSKERDGDEEGDEEDLRVKTQLRLDFKKLEKDSIELGFSNLERSKAFNELLKIIN